MTSTIDQAAALKKTLQDRIDNKTKPPGSLGRLEELALQVGMLQETASPQLINPHMLVFAADHGIAATGLVNPYPQAVTAQMVLNFLRGGAAINVMCRQNGLALRVVDAGVNFDLSNIKEPALIHEKIAFGTRSYLDGPAMTEAQTSQAVAAGRRIIRRLKTEGCNCIGLGEMGIGNTSAAALIMSFVLGIPVDECCGRGTGANDGQLQKKITTLEKVRDLHAAEIAASTAPGTTSDSGPVTTANSAPGTIPRCDPYTILRCVGGFEIAMIMGACLEAAACGMVILVDGFISTAALLLALMADPGIKDHCVYSHTSGERGHARMLAFLQARPLLDLGMRLGEGTGAAMAYPILRSAVAFLDEMASFDSAGVSRNE